MTELAPTGRAAGWRRPALAAAAAVAGVTAAAALLASGGTADPGTTAAPAVSLTPAASTHAPPAPGGGQAAKDAVVSPATTHLKARTAATPTHVAQAASGAGTAPRPAAGPPAPRRRGTPTVTALDPSSGPISGGTVVLVRGSGFTSDAVVFFGEGQALKVEVLSPTSLRATAPPHLPGEVDVTVTTSVGTSAPGSGTRFRYLA